MEINADSLWASAMHRIAETFRDDKKGLEAFIDKLMQLKTMPNVLATVEAQEPKSETIVPTEHASTDHNKKYGPRVQQYDATDITKLLRVFEGITDVTREIPNVSYTTLKIAAKNRHLCAGFRWHLVDRDDATYDQPKDIGETVVVSHSNIGTVAMLDLDRTRILQLFSTQREAARSVSQHASAISSAIKYATPLSGACWCMLAELDTEMVNAFKRENNVPVTQRRGVKVQSLDPETGAVLKEYPSIMIACKECVVSPKSIKTAAMRGAVHNGVKWKMV